MLKMNKAATAYLLTLFILVSSSCNIGGVSHNDDFYDIKTLNASTEAARAVDNMILRYTVQSTENSRNVQQASKLAPKASFFDTIDTIDEKGLKVTFSNLSIEDKAIFEKMWKQETAKLMAEDVAFNKEALFMLRLENDAFDIAYNRSRSVNDVDFDTVYMRELQRLTEERRADFEALLSTSRDVSSSKRIARATAVKYNYSEGNVFVAFGGGSSSSSGGNFGHASIITAPVWNDSFINDSSQSVCTSAWPKKNSPWSKEGVQYEPLRYWLDKDSKIHYLTVGSSKWVWAWFKSRWVYRGDASSAEKAGASSYAKAQLGKPYNWNFFNKWNTDKFYCSSLVWRAWVNISDSYNLSPNSSMCLPSNIYNARNKRFIYSE